MHWIHPLDMHASMDWIGLRWIGSGFSGNIMDWITLNRIGWDDCDPFLISNHCSTVDAVSFKL